MSAGGVVCGAFAVTTGGVKMKCPRCGADNAPENNYCLTCGAPFEKSEAENNAGQAVNTVNNKEQIEQIAEKLKGKAPGKKTALIAAAAVVVLIVVIAVIAVLSNGGGKFDMVDSVLAPTFGADGSFLVNGAAATPVSEQLGDDEGGVKITLSSMDRQTVAILMSDGDVYVSNKDGGLDQVLDGVENMTLSGGIIAYVDEDGTLGVYNIKNGKKSNVADDVNASSSIVMSPDGKYVAYVVTDKNGDDDLYVYNGKKSVEIDDALVAIAISNKGKYIYCYNTDKDGLYIYDMKGDSTKLSVGVGGTFVFNRDNTEMIFTASDGDCYISIKGGDKQKLGSGMIVPIIPGTAQHGTLYTLYSGGVFSAATYGVETLSEMFYYNTSAGTIVYLEDDVETERVASSVTYGSVSISDDGKTLYYMRDDTLYRVKENDIDESVEIAEDVNTFAMSRDGKSAYYIDEDDALWFAKGTKKPKKVADDIVSVAVTHDGYAMFIGEYSYSSNSGVLYACKNGGKKTQVLDDAYTSSSYSLLPLSSVTYCFAGYNSETGTVDMYAVESGTEFTLVVEGMR